MTKNYAARNVSIAEVEKLCSRKFQLKGICFLGLSLNVWNKVALVWETGEEPWVQESHREEELIRQEPPSPEPQNMRKNPEKSGS